MCNCVRSTAELGGLGNQGGVIFGSIDVHDRKRVGYGDVLDVVLMAMLKVACAGGRQALQENFD